MASTGGLERSNFRTSSIPPKLPSRLCRLNLYKTAQACLAGSRPICREERRSEKTLGKVLPSNGPPW